MTAVVRGQAQSYIAAVVCGYVSPCMAAHDCGYDTRFWGIEKRAAFPYTHPRWPKDKDNPPGGMTAR